MKTGTKERPIIFSAEMVRAILDGRKTQTRRVAKGPNPIDSPLAISTFGSCPYGLPGDLLWVRETWACEQAKDAYKPSEILTESVCWYNATDRDSDQDSWRGRIRSPRFMPRWASRILLEITDVRVERVQEISKQDASAEGCANLRPVQTETGVVYSYGCLLPIDFFKMIWNCLNAKRGYGWDANPWVWVVEFKVME